MFQGYNLERGGMIIIMQDRDDTMIDRMWAKVTPTIGKCARERSGC